ncbi:MAG: sigma-70 family RNA polymerase sigma factor [Pseudomonadota bacterium]
MSKGQIRTFLSRERSRLLSYTRALLWDASVDAEDVVHDVLLKLLERPDSPAPDFLAAYTYRSLKNRVTDIARTSKESISIEQENDSLVEILQDKSLTAFDELISVERQKALFEALETLNETERRVVIANELEGQTFKQLSEAWDIPTNTLLSHKSRAMKKLRKQLTRSSL